MRSYRKNFLLSSNLMIKRRPARECGPLFHKTQPNEKYRVRAQFVQLHHPARYGRSLGTLDRLATHRSTISTFFIKNILWSWPRRIRCPDVSRWTKTVEKTMFGAVLEKNIRHAYRRPQTRKIEPSTTVNGCFVPIVFFQTCLNVLKELQPLNNRGPKVRAEDENRQMTWEGPSLLFTVC